MFRRTLLTAAVALATGCGPIEHEFKKDVSYTFEPPAAGCATDVKVIDLAQEKDFEQFSGYLKSIEVTGIKVTVTEDKTFPDAVATTASGTVRIAASETEEGALLGSWKDVPLTKGNTFSLTPSAEGSARANELLLKEPHKAVVKVEGCVAEGPAGFTVEAELTVLVKAGLF